LPDPYNIALDATYSIGGVLSGVGLYSDQILTGLAAAHPEVRFDFVTAASYLRACRALLPPNARRRLVGGAVRTPRRRSLSRLNQRLPRIPMRRAIATFHDLFVMTGTYPRPSSALVLTAQARDADAQREITDPE